MMIRRKTDPPRGVLKTPASAPGSMEHARYHPSADLAHLVEHFWSVHWDFRGVPPHRVETLPHPSVHLLFERTAGCCIAGVSRAKFSRLLEGKDGVFAAKFRPGGFHPFVGVPVATFSDSTVTLRSVWGSDGDALERAVLAEHDDAARLVVVEMFLRQREPAPDDNVALVSTIVGAIAAERRIVRVEDVSARFGLGLRALQRLFAQYVGMNPKWVIQRYRLHEAAEQLALEVPPSQSALALQLGYADQAHFVRDFKRLVGASPAAYARSVRSAR
jgi:AraC-like DNA-binding protein